MTICMIGSFVSTLWGLHDGYFGEDCNLRWSESCTGVFRSRSVCYTVMMWMFATFGWELVDARRSFFDSIFSDPRAWFNRLWRNQFLFWSVIGGSLLVLPTLYIPVIDHVVFLHDGIDKEWGIVFAFSILFVMGIESWKSTKRVYLRRHGLMMSKDEVLGEEDLEARAFHSFLEVPEAEAKTG